jgi:hypothetical protein
LPIQTRLRVLAFAASTALACGPAPDALGPTPGRSNRPRGGPPVPASTAADARPKLWERWSEVAEYRLAVGRMASQHLAADQEAETRANGAAAAYPDLGPARTPTPGSVLVQRLFERGAAAPSVLFAMEKSAASPGDAAAWEFLVLDPAGLVQERGALEACVRCHAEAPHDMVFGRAR